jgi:hypothetical protein
LFTVISESADEAIRLEISLGCSFWGRALSMLVVFLAGLLARPGRRAARPPPMVVPPRPAVAAVSRTYDVAISAGDGMLWQGELRVGRDQSSSFAMNKTESGWYAACPQPRQRGSARSGLAFP